MMAKVHIAIGDRRFVGRALIVFIGGAIFVV
jgi:hypothetical protein